MYDDACYFSGGVAAVKENGEIFVESATCKDKVCVSRGRLKNSGDIAVCLPAEISIRVFGESGVDVYA